MDFVQYQFLCLFIAGTGILKIDKNIIQRSHFLNNFFFFILSPILLYKFFFDVIFFM